MGDVTDQYAEHHESGLASFWHHLTPKQKLIGGAVAGVLTAGLIAAHKKNNVAAASGSGAVATPDPVQVPVPIVVPSGSSGGVTGGIGDPGATPTVPVTTPPVAQLPVYTPPAPKPFVPAPAPKPPAQPPAPAPAPAPAPVGTYTGASWVDTGVMVNRDAAITTLVTQGASLSDAQRQALQQEVKQLDATPIAANAANTSANPVGGFGGGNYYTDGPAVAQGIALNENKLASDPAFVQSEIARTNQVIAERQAAGVGTYDQTNYLAHLNDVQAQASSTNTSGATSSRSASPSPTPTPVTQETTQQLVSDFNAHTSSQVVDGHTNPYYNSGNTVTQAQYQQLEKQVAAGGSAAQSALAQLSGARVVG